MTRKIHFGWFTEYGPIGWDAAPADKLFDWRRPQMYQEMAAICEQGKFDFALFADHLGISSTYQGSIDNYVKYGLNGINHDSTMLAATIAATTKHLGVGTTISTTLTPPYMLARQTASLDHLSAGRVAWNVVTTANVAGYRNFGLEQMPEHDSRYDQADEYMELCYRLWNSWEPDALIMDKHTGIFADPAKVKAINYEGKFYKSQGPLNIAPLPQGRPTLIQAGASERGKEFAARWADAVIAGKHDLQDMKAYYDDLKVRMLKYGRKPQELKVFFIIKPIVADTEQLARELAQQTPTDAAIHAALAALSSRMSLDLSQFDLDAPLPQLNEKKIQGGQTTLSRFQTAERRPTLREIAVEESIGNKGAIIGTPLQVADQLQHIMDYVGGDGFVVRVDAHDHAYMRQFVDKVIPVLQERNLARTQYTGDTLRQNLMEG